MSCSLIYLYLRLYFFLTSLLTISKYGLRYARPICVVSFCKSRFCYYRLLYICIIRRIKFQNQLWESTNLNCFTPWQQVFKKAEIDLDSLSNIGVWPLEAVYLLCCTDHIQLYFTAIFSTNTRFTFSGISTAWSGRVLLVMDKLYNIAQNSFYHLKCIGCFIDYTVEFFSLCTYFLSLILSLCDFHCRFCTFVKPIQTK